MTNLTTTNHRFGPYGWDHSRHVPKVNDLVVVITDRAGQLNQVLRLTEDDPKYQNVEVSDDLKDGRGLHTSYRRKGDIRALVNGDKVFVK